MGRDRHLVVTPDTDACLAGLLQTGLSTQEYGEGTHTGHSYKEHVGPTPTFHCPQWPSHCHTLDTITQFSSVVLPS